MTTPAVGSTGSVATSTATTTVDRGDQLSGDAFLQLLVAEMRYQDPSNPMSSSDMMAQTATLTQTQSLQQIATQNTQLLTLQRSLSAAGLVGRTVQYTATDGSSKTGTVTAVSIDTTKNTSTAQIGGASVDVGRITQVSA